MFNLCIKHCVWATRDRLSEDTFRSFIALLLLRPKKITAVEKYTHRSEIKCLISVCLLTRKVCCKWKKILQKRTIFSIHVFMSSWSGGSYLNGKCCWESLLFGNPQARLTFEDPNIKISTSIVSKLPWNTIRQELKPSIGLLLELHTSGWCWLSLWVLGGEMESTWLPT